MIDFIQQYENGVDKLTCDNLINFFEKSNLKKPGQCGNGVQEEIKKSTDLCLEVKDINTVKELNDYFKQLEVCLNHYKKKFIHCDDSVGKWGIQEGYNIQKYKPGEAFYGWHGEVTNLKTSHRHLVFMTYLNDVENKGETEWYYQKLKVKPKKGLTVIWPATWPFTHKGIAAETDKYIITGWFSFLL